MYLWTDSTIVQSWFGSHPSSVANRTSEVLDAVHFTCHLADWASRGVNDLNKHNHPLWWKGPEHKNNCKIAPIKKKKRAHSKFSPQELSYHRNYSQDCLTFSTSSVLQIGYEGLFPVSVYSIHIVTFDFYCLVPLIKINKYFVSKKMVNRLRFSVNPSHLLVFFLLSNLCDISENIFEWVVKSKEMKWSIDYTVNFF